MVMPAARRIDDENPADELSAGAALDAIGDALVNVTAPAAATLTVRDVAFEKVGRWVLMHAKLTDGTTPVEFTVRMPRARAEVLKARLTRVLR